MVKDNYWSTVLEAGEAVSPTALGVKQPKGRVSNCELGHRIKDSSPISGLILQDADNVLGGHFFLLTRPQRKKLDGNVWAFVGKHPVRTELN